MDADMLGSSNENKGEMDRYDCTHRNEGNLCAAYAHI